MTQSTHEPLDRRARCSVRATGARRAGEGLANVTITQGTTPPQPVRYPDGALAVRLRSPGIFTDDYGRPSLDRRWPS